MKIIFAQGNPGLAYAKNRHNLGFVAIDEIAAQNDAKWVEKPKFKALIAEIESPDRILLVKPLTFYNETGNSAKSITDFFKVIPAKDLLVIHDDLSLDFGTIRVRNRGSDAGNNGIKSLNQHIGPDYYRVRVGIDNELRSKMGDSDFVLANLSKDEQTKLETTILPQIIAIVTDFIENKLDITSQSL